MADHSRTVRGELYPEISPFNSGYLTLEAPHEMYWEQSGNPQGAPVVFLHGGPGAGSAPAHRRFFDPARYRIVVYDQRGAGRSRPLGELRDNTTPLLVEDLERLRRHLGIERWPVFGGSWGRTLELAYGIAHSIRCGKPVSSCPAFYSAGGARSSGSSTACAISSPKRGRRSRALCPRKSEAICSDRITAVSRIRIRRCTCPRRARGAFMKARARR